MISFAENINSETSGFTEKEKKDYKIDSALRLCEKLLLNKKQDLEKDFSELVQIFSDPEISEKQKLKSFKKRFNALSTAARQRYRFVEKGHLQSSAMGIGIGIGVAIGAVLQTINIGLIGVGIAIGAAVGLAIGTKNEQEAEKEGKIY